MEKSIKSLFVAVAFLFGSGNTYAGDFSFGLTTSGGNFWCAIPQMPVNLISSALLGGGGAGYTWESLSVKDSNGKIHVDGGNWFGLKARDMFSNFSYGVNFGYQPKFSPLGIFVNGSYKFRQFHMQPDRTLDGYEKYKVNTWAVGATLRITPLIGLYREAEWSPIVEIGTKYNKVFSCKAPFDGDTDQFGSGMSTSVAIGIRGKKASATIGYEWSGYDYFNRDFKTKTGLHPYADIKSKLKGISLKAQLDF